MSIKHRFIIFFLLVFTVTPGIYFGAIYFLFERLPQTISIQEHIEVYQAFLSKELDGKLHLFIIAALLFPFAAFVPHKGVKGEFGSASFATTSLIKKMKLFQKEGIVLGKYGSRLLKYKEKLSTLVLAPPGVGKTAGIAIPNLIVNKNSTIVLDVKGELYQKTAYTRKYDLGSKIYWFNPAEFESMKFNPLDQTILESLPWHKKEAIADRVANLLFEEKGGAFDHWREEGKAMFLMFCLYFIDKNGYTSIPETREFILSSFVNFYGEDYNFESENEALLYFVKEEIINDEDINDRIKEEAVNLLRKVDREFSGVLSSCKSRLNIFATATVREIFRSNDLDILKFRKEISSLYVSIQEKDMKRFEILNRIFLDFILAEILSEMPIKGDLDILGILDEFPRFGKNEYLIDSAALGRGYNFIPILIAQDYGQIKEVYGDDKISSINSTTAYKIIFAQTNTETAKNISETIGEFTRETVSQSKSAGDKGQTNVSHSKQLSGQALISKQDILNMKDDQVYILAKNFYKHPIDAKIFYYFKDRKLKKLVPQEFKISLLRKIKNFIKRRNYGSTF